MATCGWQQPFHNTLLLEHALVQNIYAVTSTNYTACHCPTGSVTPYTVHKNVKRVENFKKVMIYTWCHMHGYWHRGTNHVRRM